MGHLPPRRARTVDMRKMWDIYLSSWLLQLTSLGNLHPRRVHAVDMWKVWDTNLSGERRVDMWKLWGHQPLRRARRVEL